VVIGRRDEESGVDWRGTLGAWIVVQELRDVGPVVDVLVEERWDKVRSR
jgi:hypothetical protein